MKVLIICYSGLGGGKARAAAYKDFLQFNNHSVTMIQFPGKDFSAKLWYYYQQGRSYFKNHEKRFMEKTADMLEKKIKKGNYEVVIGVDTLFSYVLTRNLDCVKIFSCESLAADELYYSRKFGDLNRVRNLREMELEILQKSDQVIFPWKTTENYVRKFIWNGPNFVTIKFGCYPEKKTVSYFSPVSIVSLGNVSAYWSNPELISYLTRISPYVIDVYSKYKPDKKLHLNYKGYASSLDILNNYQFGLNTVSKDNFRRNHHSSRILSYLARGLPVLSPDWLIFSHELKGVLPFNEDNFLEILNEYSDPDAWTKISQEAYEQALELDWKKVLQPLKQIIESRLGEAA